jgi:hypothetical protein
VPQLLFRNFGDLAVFLLDGEELVGAKQNRVLNLSILAPARRDTVIPVSCVEAGRWRHTSAEFSSTSHAQFAESRAKRAAHVSEDILRGTGRRSDQQEVWRDIDDKLARLGQHSPSSAVGVAFTANEDLLSRHVGKFEARPRQVGSEFALDGKVVGLELFDCEATCAALMPKIVRSYALDAIDRGCMTAQYAAHQTPKGFLQQLREAPVHEAPAVGEGTDLRIEQGAGLAGGALRARGRIVHLVAFVDPNPGYKQDGYQRGRRILAD